MARIAELDRVSEIVKQKYVIVRFSQPYSALSGTESCDLRSV